MVLAAGLGTRLRPLTDELPKPLVWLGDRPLLGGLLQRFAAASRVVVNAHHLREAFRGPSLRSGGREALVSLEEEVLGTAGGVRHAAALLSAGDVLVWNGDILAEPRLGELVVQHARRAAFASWVVAPRARGEGTVGLDGEGCVVRLRGRVFGDEERGGDFIGVQLLSPRARAALPERGCLVGDVALPALARGERIATVALEGPWYDIGTPRSYLDANLRWLRERGEPAFLGPGATVEPGVQLDEALVGAGATVVGRGALRRVVVWPGARAEAPLEGAVVTARAVLRVPVA